MATHFGPDNTPNGFMSKTMTVFLLPLVLLALHWVCIFSGKYMPDNVGSSKLGMFALWIIPAASVFSGLVIYGYALNEQLDVGRMALTFVGALLLVVGNYMPKVTRNWVVGIKIPTTLADEDNWNRTHRFAAPVWVIGGLAMLVCGLTGILTGVLAAVLLIAMVLLPVGYSLMLAAKAKKK